MKRLLAALLLVLALSAPAYAEELDPTEDPGWMNPCPCYEEPYGPGPGEDTPIAN